MTNTTIPVQWRYEGEIVPSGVVLITKVGRLHTCFQEKRGDDIWRIHIAIPTNIPDDMLVDEFLGSCSADTEVWTKEDQSASEAFDNARP